MQKEHRPNCSFHAHFANGASQGEIGTGTQCEAGLSGSPTAESHISEVTEMTRDCHAPLIVAFISTAETGGINKARNGALPS